ncbi:ferroxidase fet3 [Scheffersomyces spartinae]|uniref:Ferroxidase fet3 n=1 Tax=Scheffersomyces spartinae TaxID=45513 RepID=A0A9P7V638_9ASCO|nr:ferroxidase fet3 [Scheffersomyces spartinae]KAG7191864.1 ferroxidase fet3 [Scheffersomyces spartinae]
MNKLLVLVVSFLLAFVVKAEDHYWYFNATWLTGNPDGVMERPIIGFNGSWPLPTLRVKTGDRVVLKLTNGLGNQNTSLHFHGMFQNGTGQMDGPEMITQCPIAPDDYFVYNFTVPDQVGTYWYHSHTDGQYPDGLRGVFVIEEAKKSDYPFDFDEEITLSVSEWYHKTSHELTPKFLNRYNPTGAEPIPQNSLFNDSRNVTWRVQPNTTYFVRIVNVGRFVSQYLYMEDHDFTVVEVDGVYVQPNTTSMVYITAAQRYGVLIKTKETTDKNFAFMNAIDKDMLDVVPKDLILNSTNYISYDESNDTPEEYIVDEYDFLDDYWLTPVSAEAMLDEPDHVITVDVTMNNLGNGINYAFFNNITYTPPKVPILHTVLSAGELATNELVYGTNTHSIVLQHNEVVDIVLNNHDAGKHPFHLHGHVFQLVARGETVVGDPVSFNATEYDLYRDNPMRRDTVYVNPQSYIVMRFRADNPGVWFFHCHIGWHLQQGLAFVLVEAPLQIQETETQHLTEGSIRICKNSNNGLYEGNAAGNKDNFLDLKGENVQHKPLPAGFTARGIVALVFSCLAGILGLVAITYYGLSDLKNVEMDLIKDLNVELDGLDESSQTNSSDSSEHISKVQI